MKIVGFWDLRPQASGLIYHISEVMLRRAIFDLGVDTLTSRQIAGTGLLRLSRYSTVPYRTTVVDNI